MSYYFADMQLANSAAQSPYDWRYLIETSLWQLLFSYTIPCHDLDDPTQYLTRYVKRDSLNHNSLFDRCMRQINITPAVKLLFLKRFTPSHGMSGRWIQLIPSALCQVWFVVMLGACTPYLSNRTNQSEIIFKRQQYVHATSNSALHSPVAEELWPDTHPIIYMYIYIYITWVVI